MSFERNQPAIEADGLDITMFVDSCTWNQVVDELPCTTFADDNKIKAPGMRDYSFSFTAYQDFAAAGFHSKMQAILGLRKPWRIQAKKGAAFVPDAENPMWSFEAFLSNYSAIEGTTEELTKTSCTVSISGAVAYAES